MRLIPKVLALALLIGWAGVASADCPPGQKLRLVGRIKTGATALGASMIGGTGGTGPTVTTEGKDIHRIIGRCGGTACVVGIANVDEIKDAAAADYVIEPGAIANGMIDVDLTGEPLYFSAGISVSDTTGDVNNIALYACETP